MPDAERLRPATDAECAELLAGLAADRRAVRVRGGGTKDHLGPLRPTAVVLETTGLAGIVDHVPADLTVTVRAGTRLAALREALAAAGQILPLDPPHVARGATVGGVIAANSNGFGRHRYGGVRDLLIGLRAALADGTLVRTGGRVVKNVAGYDLDKLFTGSLGTLGVIVEATFKVLPLPPATRATVVAFRGAADAFGAADALLRTSLRPSALVAERAAGRWRLTVAAAGEPAPVQRAMAEAARVAGERAATAEPIDRVEAALAALREIVDDSLGGAVVRAALPLSAQLPFAEAAARSEATARIVVDVSSAIVHVHLEGDDGAVVAAADALLADARVLGGSARIERSAVAGLATFVPMPPPGAFLMRRLKEAFDPVGILEPQRSAIG